MKKIEKPKHQNLIMGLILGVLFQYVASFLMTETLKFFPTIAGNYANDISGLMELTVSSILAVCIIGPILEELLFRGLIMHLADLILPFFVANIIQAICFSFYHTNNVQKIYAFILGLFIGHISHKTRHITTGMAFHIALNTMGLFLGTIVTDETQFTTKLVIFILCIPCIVASYRKLKR